MTEQHLDLAVEYDSLCAAGAIMGSGGLVTMDEDTCIVELARYFFILLKMNPVESVFPVEKGPSIC